ncbi:cell division protein PerM [Corynebacterium sp. S7]
MSKKSSPRSGSVRKSSTRALSGVRRPRVNVNAPQKKKPEAPTNQRERIRHYLPVVLIPNTVIVLAIVVFSFAGILFSGGKFSALPALIAETWFVVHLVPVTFDGVNLGVLPLLPAMGLVILLSRRIRRAVKDRVSVLDLYTLTGLVCVIPLTLTGIAWFMVWDASQVFPVEAPSAITAIVQTLIIHLAGLVIGMGPTLWKLLARRSAVPEGIVTGAQMASKILVRLTLVAGVVYLILLGIGHVRLGEVLAAYPILSTAGGVGLFVACLLYLPNAAIGTLSVLLGGDISIGAGQVSLFSIDLVPLPVFPLFAAIPGAVASWAPALMLIPLAVLIHFVAKRSWDPISAASTAVFAGIWAFLLAYLASGELGGYGYAGPTAWLMALLMIVWVGIVVFAAWGVAKVRNRPPSTPEVSEEGEKEEQEEISVSTTENRVDRGAPVGVQPDSNTQENEVSDVEEQPAPVENTEGEDDVQSDTPEVPEAQEVPEAPEAPDESDPEPTQSN